MTEDLPKAPSNDADGVGHEAIVEYDLLRRLLAENEALRAVARAAQFTIEEGFIEESWDELNAAMTPLIKDILEQGK